MKNFSHNRFVKKYGEVRVCYGRHTVSTTGDERRLVLFPRLV